MEKNFHKNSSVNISSNSSQKSLLHTTKSETDGLKTASKSAIQKTAKATGDLIDNLMADKITKNLPQKNLDADSQTEKLTEIQYTKFLDQINHPNLRQKLKQMMAHLERGMQH